MRELSATPATQTILENACKTDKSVAPMAKIVLKESRVFSNTLTRDNPPSWVDDTTGISETPIPQDAHYSEAGSGFPLSVSVIGGKLAMSKDGNSGVCYLQWSDVDIVPLAKSKPALVWDSTGSKDIIFYIASDGTLYKCETNPTLVNNLDADSITARSTVATGFASGAIHAITPDKIAVFFLDDGGIAVRVYTYSGSWSSDTWGWKFVFPTRTIDDEYMCVTSAAVSDGSDDYFYVSDWGDGSVLGVHRLSSGKWSDGFTACPADLTKFFITNAFYAKGKFVLSGQFERTKEFDINATRNMSLRSANGKTYSWDRNVMFSALGYRFLCFVSDDNYYAYASNRVLEFDLTHELTDTPEQLAIPGSDIVAIKTSSKNKDNSCTIVIADGDETYRTHSLVKKGAFVDIYLGYNGYYMDDPYLTGIVMGIARSRRDGVRRLSLDVQSEGFGKLNNLTYPFYVEIVGKTVVRDECFDYSNLYTANMDLPHETDRYLTVDFKDSKGYTETGVTAQNVMVKGGVAPITSTGTHKLGVETTDIKVKNGLTAYPIVTSSNVIVYAYGWSRTNSDVANDTITVKLRVVDADGDERIETGTVGGGGAQWPRTYYPSAAGSTEVSYTFTGVVAGEEITNVIVIVESVNTTTWCLERVAFRQGIEYSYIQHTGNTPWELWETGWSEGVPTEDEIEELGEDAFIWQLKIPGTGRPYTMFSSKPYDARNFMVKARFDHWPGKYPMATTGFGTASWGVIGHAVDNNNFVVAMLTSGGFFAIRTVRDGDTDVTLDSCSVSFVADMVHDIMLEYKDGVYRAWFKAGTSDSWGDPDLVGEVTENTGALLPGDEGIAHVGVYGFLDPVDFRIASFDINDCVGMVLMPGEDTFGTKFVGQPATGAIKVDDVVYHYSSKTPTAKKSIGPYQGLATGSSGGDTFAEIAWFDWDNGSTDWQNYLLGTDNGKSWQIDSTEWQPSIKDRSRHFADDIGENAIGKYNRAIVGPGFIVDFIISGEATQHEYNSLASMNGTDELKLVSFYACNGEHDASVADMLNMLCTMGGVEAEFPGDYLNSSIVVNADTKTEIQ